MPSKLDTKKLRKLATDATQPGPWSVSDEHPNLILDANGFWLADVGPAPRDAAFIAAMSPEVVIALLDRIETNAAERDVTTVTVDGLVYGEHMIRQLCAERGAMRANYDRLVAKARQFERYPGGEGARVELRSALDALGQLDDDRKEHDWLACPDCRALSDKEAK